MNKLLTFASSADALRLFRARREIEELTNRDGATLRRRMMWPTPLVHVAGAATDDEILALRAVIGCGDLAEVIGPLEFFLIASGPVALTLSEAIREADL